MFSVEMCWATVGSDPFVQTYGHKDTFFDAQCPLDETMDMERDPVTSKFVQVRLHEVV